MMQVYYTPTSQSDWILPLELPPASVQIAAARLLDSEGNTYQISLSRAVLKQYLRLKDILTPPNEVKSWASNYQTRTVTLECSSGQTISFRDIPRLDTLIGVKNTVSDTVLEPYLSAGLTSGDEGRKLDDGKLDWSLLPPEEVEEIVRVLCYGAKKYKRDNWQRVPDGRRRYFNAALRHLWAWWKGESKDPESGLSHLAHSICCMMFMLWMEKNKKNDGKVGQTVSSSGYRSGGMVQGPLDPSWCDSSGQQAPGTITRL